jgi:hypothetical protein
VFDLSLPKLLVLAVIALVIFGPHELPTIAARVGRALRDLEFRANMPISASARRGDPHATGPAILAIADAEEPPLRVFLGDQPLPLLRTEYRRRHRYRT